MCVLRRFQSSFDLASIPLQEKYKLFNGFWQIDLCVIELSSQCAEFEVLKGVCYICNDKRVVWMFIEPPALVTYFPLKRCPVSSAEWRISECCHIAISLCISIVRLTGLVWGFVHKGVREQQWLIQKWETAAPIIFAAHPGPSTGVPLLKLLCHRLWLLPSAVIDFSLPWIR